MRTVGKPAQIGFYGLAVNELIEQPALIGEATVPFTKDELVRMDARDRPFEVGPETNILHFDLAPSALPAIAAAIVADRERWSPVSLAGLLMYLEKHLGEAEVLAAVSDALQRG